MLCGIALQTLILLAVVWRTDWKAEAAQASSRVQKWGGKGTDDDEQVNKPLLEWMNQENYPFLAKKMALCPTL